MLEYVERCTAIAKLTALEIREPCATLTDARRLLADMPAVSVPQWISVKDKLPEPGELVLIWYEYFRYGDYNRMYKIYGLGYQYEGFWSGVDPLGDKARVFAWMPLPKPPKGENDG
mgnify:CR=1 FL=1